MNPSVRPITRRFLRILSSQIPKPSNLITTNPISKTTSRNYSSSELRKFAVEENMLRLIRNQVQLELNSSSPQKPVMEFNGYNVDERPGEQWIRLTRKFGEKEEIKIEASMFDGDAPAGDPASDSDSGEGPEEARQLHITFVVNISKGKNSDVFEILCSAWPDTIEINKVFIRRHEEMPTEPYMPEFDKLDEELQDSLYTFLEERGIDDELAVFLHQYMENKDTTEFVRWMGTLKSYFGAKTEGEQSSKLFK